MADEHVLHTELSVDECKERLKTKAQMATFFPEMRGKSVIGGVKKDRFWIQESGEASSRYQYGASVFYGRLSPDASGGTRITGHYARSTIGRLGTAFTIIFVAGLLVATVLQQPFDWKKTGWLLLALVWTGGWIAVASRAARDHQHKIISFLRRVLEAKPVSDADTPSVRH